MITSTLGPGIMPWIEYHCNQEYRQSAHPSLAIQPSISPFNSYRLTVSVPDMAQSGWMDPWTTGNLLVSSIHLSLETEALGYKDLALGFFFVFEKFDKEDWILFIELFERQEIQQPNPAIPRLAQGIPTSQLRCNILYFAGTPKRAR
jgi:hypothetical protein